MGYEEGDRGKRPLSLPGKDAIDDTQRMVVQVRAAGEGGGRKVEIVEDRGERRDRKRKVELHNEDRDRDRNEDSDSEKENEQKKRREKSKHKDKSREKEKHRNKDKDKGKEINKYKDDDELIPLL